MSGDFEIVLLQFTHNTKSLSSSITNDLPDSRWWKFMAISKIACPLPFHLYFEWKSHFTFPLRYSGLLVSQPLFFFYFHFLLILIFDSVDFQDCLLPSLNLIGTCECAFKINTTNVATLLVRSTSIQYPFPKDMCVDNIDTSVAVILWW